MVPYRERLTFEPTLGIYDENGNYTLSTIGDVRNNPYAVIKGNTDKREGDGFIGNVNLDYEIVKHLKFHTSFGSQMSSSRAGYYSSSTILGGSSVNGRASMSNYKSKNLLSENYLTYDNALGDIHHLTLMTGYSYQSARYESMSASSQSFVTDAFGFWNLGAGATPLSPGSGLSEWAILSYYGRMNYNMKDRYLITLTGRYDGSSRFGANNKWAFFPSGAVAWNVKHEPFLQDLNTLSNLKLRASYGLTGNTEIGAYNSLARLSNILTVVGGQQVNAVVPSSVSNASLSWESTKQLDIGLDIGFFKRRVNLTADYYNKVTDNLLYNVPLPAYSGYSSSLKNWGKIGNKGVELTLNTVNTTRAFKWNTYFNIAFNKNEILDLPGKDVIWTQGFLVSSTNIRTVGSPIGVFYGYKFDGVYQEGDNFSAEPSKQPGDAKYMDINGRDAEGNLTGKPDGVVNSDDRTIIGNPNPDFTFGFTNTFDYKNFSLSIFLNGSVGNDIANYTRMELETMNGFNNSTTAYLDAWTPSHTNTDVPAVGSYSFEFSDRWIENGSFLRVKDITLGYNLPSSLTKKMSVANARLYISGQNILTFTKYSGFDPEVSWQDSNSQFGSDYGSYPNVKSYTLGVNIIF